MPRYIKFLLAIVLVVAGAAMLLFARDREFSLFGFITFDGLPLGVVLVAVGLVDLVASILPSRRGRS